MTGSGLDLDELLALARTFAEREARDAETYPAANIAALQDASLVGAPFAPALGGHGWSLLEATLAVEAIAAASPSTALLWAMPLGLAGVLAEGAEVAPAGERAAYAAQIERIAARYRAREWYAACNSEAGAGGSLAATKTVAQRGADGAFRLSGTKILASSGAYAQHFFSTAKVTPEELPGAGVVEFFLLRTDAPGVVVGSDWDGFGMRSTESHSVRYTDAAAEELLGFPNYLELVQPLQYWFCLFAAIPLGCARGILEALGTPRPASAALRLRLADATMRYEALRAYLSETAREWRVAAGPAYAARVLRTKTYVTQEATRLAAELFALSGGRHYRRGSALARLLADSFAGTALRPPLAQALDTLTEQFGAEQ
jgi:alkylation response protein AidB-like acyl-CoA dehydrogenase